jgi:hypothetical protein
MFFRRNRVLHGGTIPKLRLRVIFHGMEVSLLAFMFEVVMK